jgi:hypothetical protein
VRTTVYFAVGHRSYARINGAFAIGGVSNDGHNSIRRYFAKAHAAEICGVIDRKLLRMRR